MDETKPARLTQEQVASIRRMLQKTVDIAEHASLSGSFREGAGFAVQQYNAWLRALEEQGSVPAGFFVTLADDSSFDVVGVACAILASYLESEQVQSSPGFVFENHNEAQFSPQELAQVRELLNRHMEE